MLRGGVAAAQQKAPQAGEPREARQGRAHKKTKAPVPRRAEGLRGHRRLLHGL